MDDFEKLCNIYIRGEYVFLKIRKNMRSSE